MSTVIIMGPSGCGKTTVANCLRHLTNCTYIEGDDYHPPENVAKITSGIPLTDEDRQPWLFSLHSAITKARQSSTFVVATCSALKRQYRTVLGQPPNSGILFVFLSCPKDVLEDRVSSRKNHFLPSCLVQSQLDTLEPPNSDEENVLLIDATLHPKVISAQILSRLGFSEFCNTNNE
nr:carbohydrate kinase thermoresistant glucokinase [Hymenolepis microstoma]